MATEAKIERLEEPVVRGVALLLVVGALLFAGYLFVMCLIGANNYAAAGNTLLDSAPASIVVVDQAA